MIHKRESMWASGQDRLLDTEQIMELFRGDVEYVRVSTMAWKLDHIPPRRMRQALNTLATAGLIVPSSDPVHFGAFKLSLGVR